ncbi:MAG: MoaD/ThiS family protein [Longimicrobiales bacterium]
MSVIVRIPTVLRRTTAGQAEVAATGATLGEVFQGVGSHYNEFLAKVLTETGELQPFLNVYVNGEDVRLAGELRTPVHEGDEVSIIPSIAGGAAVA